MKFLLFTVLLITAGAQAQTTSRKTIAVLNFKNATEVSKGEAEILADRLRIELFNTGFVDVMEREQMQTVLAEQGFQQSGACSDEGCMVEMGKLLGVQKLVTGSIGKLGNLFLLNIRSIDVATGRIDKVVSEDIDGNIEQIVCRLRTMAYQLTSSQAPPPLIQKTAPPATASDAKPEPETTKESRQPSACAETVFLETLQFSAMLKFTVEKATYDEIVSDIEDAIESAVDDEINDDLEVKSITPEQITQLPPDCKSGIVRMIFDAYSTRPSSDQFAGKAKARFQFYATPQAQKPSFTIAIEEEGSRHWGDQQPLMNAFQEIADVLEELLADHDKIEILDPLKK